MANSVGTDQADANGAVLSVDDAMALCERALQQLGYEADAAHIVAENLIDAELCGYPALGLARLLTIAEDPRTAQPRRPVSIVHETPVSALIDGGNYVGLYALHRAVEIALAKARTHHFAVAGVHNSYLSGRNARYLETIARAGFVGIHTASSQPWVVPLGGKVPALGTNPIAIGVPNEPDPLIFDMGTSAITHGEVVLAARLREPLQEGVAVDADGLPTRDAGAALAGGILPLAGHKGYGLAFMVQALGVMAGAELPHVPVKGFGFLFVLFDPGLLMPPAQFRQQLAAFVERVKTTPRQPGVDEIRMPSERAFRDRERNRRTGVRLARALHERIAALAAGK
jgi:LDH2 family malate/lactate/ureidoglycolate dehydrogenase